MNILVIGSTGWTGKKVVKELERRGYVFTRPDEIGNHPKTYYTISHKEVFEYIQKWEEENRGNSLPYDWVLNCAGVTGVPNVDACETYKEKTIYGNTVFPILLEQALKRHKFTRLAHFSSGCIYTGRVDTVNAEPNFTGSTYSLSKAVSDTYLSNGKAVVFRIRMPFTPDNHPKNYLTKIRKYAVGGKLVDLGQNSLTSLNEAVRVAIDIMEKNLPNGPYNLVNKGSIDMKELTAMMELNPKWYTPEEFSKNTAAGRSTCVIPAYEGMSNLREQLVRCVFPSTHDYPDSER